MAVASSWMIASANLAAAATVGVNAATPAIAAGDYYLRDPEPTRSLVDALQAAIASVVPGSTVYVGQDRRVRIDFAGAATTISIPVELRELLGFAAAGYGPVTELAAEQVSILLWSPGWPETTTGSPVGVLGRRVWDRVFLASPTGQSFDAVTHASLTRVSWSWSAVRPGRAWTTAQSPGEFVRFFEAAIVPARRFKLYSGTLEDDASAAAVTWPSPLGPYVVPEPDFDWYQRFLPNTDSLGANLAIAAMATSEYS